MSGWNETPGVKKGERWFKIVLTVAAVIFLLAMVMK
jgi:hypothetical protein